MNKSELTKLARQVIRDRKIRKWILDCIKDGWNPSSATDIFEGNMPDIPKKYQKYFYSELAARADNADSEEEYRKYNKMYWDAKDKDPTMEILHSHEGALALVHAALRYALRK